MSHPTNHGECECGHNWWQHAWNSNEDIADSCMYCHCNMYTPVGTSCYWLVRMYYDLQYHHHLYPMPIMTHWIGEEKRYEQYPTRANLEP